MNRRTITTAAMITAATALFLVTDTARPSTLHAPGTIVSEWATPDGTGGNHWSPLDDIDAGTVGGLEVAWTYRTGDMNDGTDGPRTAFQATPIVVDGVLHVVTPFSRAIALDAETGEELWTFDPGVDRAKFSTMKSRGLAHWQASDSAEAAGFCGSRILLAAFDANLWALDARTGDPCPGFSGGVVDLGEGVPGIEGRRDAFKQTAPPAVIGDVVVVGSVIPDGQDAASPSGVVRGFDVRDGSEVWRWEPLITSTTRDGSEVVTGAANTWATITADPDRDLVFVPTGSPSPDSWGGLRPGDNRYANSLVALRGTTGEIVWHYQLVHHDLWDYDLPSPPLLATVERDGGEIDVVVQTTKMGYVFVFDRDTGEPVFPIEEVPVPTSDIPGEVTSPTQPVPTLPRPLVPQGFEPEDAWGLTPLDRGACRARVEKLRSEGVYTPPSLEGSIANPGFLGGMEWGGSAFDPHRRILVTNTNRLPMVTTLVPREVADTARGADGEKAMHYPNRGAPWGARLEPLLSPLGIPCSAPPWGMLHGVDLDTGEIVWEIPLGTMSDVTGLPTPPAWGSPNLGGPLMTGGLVFIGASMDRRVRAFDAATGRKVWSAKMPASVQSTPLTYRVRPGGRQFVVFTAGGHGELGSSLGDHVVAFALPAPGAGADR
jgi:quinoprotein glucose dehydrogenase